MEHINFNNLNDDIKSIIFNINRNEALINKVKKRFKCVLNDIKLINVYKHEGSSHLHDNKIKGFNDELCNYYEGAYCYIKVIKDNDKDMINELSDFNDMLINDYDINYDMIYNIFIKNETDDYNNINFNNLKV